MSLFMNRSAEEMSNCKFYQRQKIFSSFSKYYEWDNHVMWLVLKIFNIPCPSVKNSWYWYIRNGQSRCSGLVAGHHVVVLEVLLLSLSHVSHLVPETTKLFFQKIPITNNLQIKLKTNKSFKAIKLVIANFILNVSPSVSSIYPFHFIFQELRWYSIVYLSAKQAKCERLKFLLLGREVKPDS